MVDDIAHPFAVCLAAYDCDFDRVRVVGRQDYSDLVGPGDPYAEFPSAVLVRTLLSHELTHALIQHTAMGAEVPLIDHEYTAAAMELELMEPQWRDLILDYSGLDGPSESRIDIWIYRLEPRRFAANAWLHFSAPGNGCDLVLRLVRGDFSFDGDAK
jgi:hypothetical protein